MRTAPWTLEEINEAIAGRNEVRYERNVQTAALWIERAKATEARNGRPNTQFEIGKVGRRTVVFVTRVQGGAL